MEGLAWDLVKYLVGLLSGGIGAYVALAIKFAKMDGKLDVLIGQGKLADENKEKIGELDHRVKTNRKDINESFGRLRAVEEKVSKH